MRVTQNTSANLVTENLQTILQRQTQLEQYASTGIKVSNPGDDPSTAQQILGLQAQKATTAQYARNITSGTTMLSMSDSAMSSMSDALTRTQQIAVQMASGTSSNSTEGAVQELQQLKSQMISLGNTQMNGKYIFGGFKNDTPPFDPSGAFSGTADTTNVQVDSGTSVAVSYSGSALISGGIPPGSSGTDIMQMYDGLIAAVKSGDSTQVHDLLGSVSSASSQVLTGRAIVGASMNRLTDASTAGSAKTLAITSAVSSMQDVDYLQVVSDLTKQQTAYQTAIAASAKVSQISLLDYLK